MNGLKRLAGFAALAVVLAGSGAAQVQEGNWIDLFDGETLFGWNQLGDAPWRVEDGAMVCDSGAGSWIVTTSRFRDFELTASVKVSAGCLAGVAVRAKLEGHPSVNGTPVLVLSTPKDTEAKWKSVRIVAQGGKVTAEVDGAASDLACGNAVGYIGFQYYHNGGARVDVKDVKLRPLGLNPIFNGRNLDGWNILPDRKSVFKVVDGAINITNGNGQIETDGVYQDFILQMDIISNGEHLNSGVFFRGPKGVFWKGYESQVRNQWKDDDRTQPVDFGTGGNYGNQPARKVVPSDHEWFQKTIVCDGNHAAVWINGYLVSDFLDVRPAVTDANGKAGYVGEAGTIHLQGHDPTTDLSFKNINIQEY